MKKFWSFVKSTRLQPENLSFYINHVNNQQCKDPAIIAQEFNDLFTSFLHIIMILLKLHLQSLKFRIFALCRLILTWFLTELRK